MDQNWYGRTNPQSDAVAQLRAKQQARLAASMVPLAAAIPTRKLVVPGMLAVANGGGTLGPLPIQWPTSSGFITGVGVSTDDGAIASFFGFQLQLTAGASFDLFTTGQAGTGTPFPSLMGFYSSEIRPLYREFTAQVQWQAKLTNNSSNNSVTPRVWFEFIEDVVLPV